MLQNALHHHKYISRKLIWFSENEKKWVCDKCRFIIKKSRKNKCLIDKKELGSRHCEDTAVYIGMLLNPKAGSRLRDSQDLTYKCMVATPSTVNT